MLSDIEGGVAFVARLFRAALFPDLRLEKA
jgi:hypothetical protein